MVDVHIDSLLLEKLKQTAKERSISVDIVDTGRFGEKWMPSIPVMQVLALIGILQSVLFFNGSVIRACGKPSWELGIMLLNTVCSVIGSCWLCVGASWPLLPLLLLSDIYSRQSLMCRAQVDPN